MIYNWCSLWHDILQYKLQKIVIITVIMISVPLTSARTVLVENCCFMPTVFEDEHFHNCEKSINVKDTKYLTKIARSACETECAFRSLNLYSQDGTFNSTEFAQFLDRRFNETTEKSWIDVFLRNFHSCTKKALAREDDLKRFSREFPYNLEILNCSPVPAYVNICFNIFNLLYCPEGFWQNNTHCNQMKGSIRSD